MLIQCINNIKFVIYSIIHVVKKAYKAGMEPSHHQKIGMLYTGGLRLTLKAK